MKTQNKHNEWNDGMNKEKEKDDETNTVEFGVRAFRTSSN